MKWYIIFFFFRFEMRRHLVYILLGHLIILKCVNVSMIYALLSILNSCLCFDKHLNIIIFPKRGISFYYSFCSHTNWCFVAKRERSTIIFPLECLKEKVNCLYLAFGYRTRVRLHRLLLLPLFSVMSRSTQVVSFFVPCYYHNMSVWNNLRLMHANTHTHTPDILFQVVQPTERKRNEVLFMFVDEK